MLGVPVVKTTYMLGDDMSLILNTSILSRPLKKGHAANQYARVRQPRSSALPMFAAKTIMSMSR